MAESNLPFQDDGTSCNSPSLSVTVSEDVDDLHLGAEAIMFSPRFEDDIDNKRKLARYFTVVKNSGQDGLGYSYSTISSISDLIDARKGNPDDLLFRLGFALLEGEDSHFSILSRFNSQSDGSGGVSLCGQRPTQTCNDAKFETNAHDGIVKTQEWLNNQDDLNNSLQVASTAKDGMATCKAGNVVSQNQGKRVQSQKRRLRWSKSRQSSFEHLLPNLEEEETVVNARDLETSDESKHSKPIGPIRESSQEKDEISNWMGDAGHEPVHSGRAEVAEKLHQLNSTMDQKHNCPLDPVTAAQFEPITSKIPTCNAEQPEEVLSAFPENSPNRLLPWKQSQFAMIKADSFELEEIASNDGRSSPRPIKQSICAMVPNSITRNDIPQEAINTEVDISVNGLPHSLASSESSSGFDEGIEDLPQRRNSMSSIDERLLCDISPPDPVVSEAMCSIAHSACTVKSSWQKLLDFCLLRSKIACASGIAEYVLLQSKIRTTPSEIGNSSCKNRSKPFTHGNRMEFRQFSRNRKYLFRHRASGQKQLSDQNGSDTWSETPHLEDSIARKTEWLSSLVSRSHSGISNANNSNSSGSGQRSGHGTRLCRFSSMPTLTTVTASSPCLKTSHQSDCYFERDRALTLMSSITDVTYLSFRAPRNTVGTKPQNRPSGSNLPISHRNLTEIAASKDKKSRIGNKCSCNFNAPVATNGPCNLRLKSNKLDDTLIGETSQKQVENGLSCS